MEEEITEEDKKKNYAKEYYRKNREAILEYQKKKYIEYKKSIDKHYKPKVKVKGILFEKKSVIITFD
jgi:hypothetical protein|tara:strand:+ start:985 stop:1185 length:201 start_codon:yes stop_codon:yes gene_type:complete